MPPNRHGRRSVLTDPGMILLVVLLALAAVVFAWWPAETYWNGLTLVGWLMFGSLPIIIGLTLAYVVWMERLERAAEEKQQQRR